MTTIPTLNVPMSVAQNKADFGILGDLANSYRQSQAEQLRQQQALDTHDLAKRGYAQYLGLPDPGPSSQPPAGGWLSSLKNYIGQGLGLGGNLNQPFAGVPASNMVTPTMTPAIPQDQVRLPMARPTNFG